MWRAAMAMHVGSVYARTAEAKGLKCHACLQGIDLGPKSVALKSRRVSLCSGPGLHSFAAAECLIALKATVDSLWCRPHVCSTREPGETFPQLQLHILIRAADLRVPSIQTVAHEECWPSRVVRRPLDLVPELVRTLQSVGQAQIVPAVRKHKRFDQGSAVPETKKCALILAWLLQFSAS